MQATTIAPRTVAGGDEMENGMNILTSFDNRLPTPFPGAWRESNGACSFRVWAPRAEFVELVKGTNRTVIPLEKETGGIWRCTCKDIAHGTSYCYRIDGERERPDPASQWQPEGVHGPSAVVDHTRYTWRDHHWKGIELKDTIIYELHVGTFSPEGTFDGAAERLDHLCALGVTAIEIMPVAQFTGERNWGYDGVYPFAVQSGYGGVGGLKRFIDECHIRGLAVILDVVYNHLGPEGNYLWDYGPYFIENKYRTPWGAAVNFDDADSDGVRTYFIANALYWFNYFHIDGLRLDAVHAIFDMSARPFLEELADCVRDFNAEADRNCLLIAESDLNDPRLIRKKEKGGMELDAQWSDDLHHALHTALTGETSGYYQDFTSVEQVADALQNGYSYCGQRSTFRKRRFGRSPFGCTADSFIVCSQNHDQVGNRMLGERLISLAGYEGARLAAATILFSPMIPLLFMGEEWGEINPFLYFVDHSDKDLCQAVREGRKREFEFFHLKEGFPDPTEFKTFSASKLDWSKVSSESGRCFFAFYQKCICLRKEHPVLKENTFENCTATVSADNNNVVIMTRSNGLGTIYAVMNFSTASAVVTLPAGVWKQLLSSNQKQWGGEEEADDSRLFDRLVQVASRCFCMYELISEISTEEKHS